MDYEVSLQTVAACPTAVVAQATTWQEFPRIWVRLLDQVYAFVRAGGAVQDGQNIMLYRDDVPNVEVGVQVAGRSRPPGGSSRRHFRRARSRPPCTAGRMTDWAPRTRRSWPGAPHAGTASRARAGKSTATGERTPRSSRRRSAT